MADVRKPSVLLVFLLDHLVINALPISKSTFCTPATWFFIWASPKCSGTQ